MSNITDEEMAPWANNAMWLFMEKKFFEFSTKEELARKLQEQDPKPQPLADQKTYVKRANFWSAYATVQVVYQTSGNTTDSSIRLLAFIFADNLIVTIATRALVQEAHKKNVCATKSNWKQIDNLGLLSKSYNEFRGNSTGRTNHLTKDEISYLDGSNVLAKELQRINKTHQDRVQAIFEEHRKKKDQTDDEDSMVGQLSKKCSELQQENAALREENLSLKKKQAVMEQDYKALELYYREAADKQKAAEVKKKSFATMMTGHEGRKATETVDLLM